MTGSTESRWHQPTLDYAARRTAEGLSKKDIIRCLKRNVVREIFNTLIIDHASNRLVAAASPITVGQRFEA